MSTQNRGKLCTWRDAITYQYTLLPASLLLCQEHRLITRSDIIDAIAHFVEETLSPRRAASSAKPAHRKNKKKGGGGYTLRHITDIAGCTARQICRGGPKEMAFGTPFFETEYHILVI